MKKLLSILLIGVLFGNLLTGIGAYALLRWQTREAMEAQLKQSLGNKDLTLVVVDKTNQHQVSFSWFSDDEFSYRGHMYDIAHKEQHGNKTYYYCLDDSREASLNKELDNQMFGLGNTSKQKHKPTNNWFAGAYLVYIHPSISQVLHFGYFTKSRAYFRDVEVGFVPLTVTPPPENRIQIC